MPHSTLRQCLTAVSCNTKFVLEGLCYRWARLFVAGTAWCNGVPKCMPPDFIALCSGLALTASAELQAA